jgi:hypothetical protein
MGASQDHLCQPWPYAEDGFVYRDLDFTIELSTMWSDLVKFVLNVGCREGEVPN